MRSSRFRNIVWTHYKTCGRSLPWRRTRNPYNILVSEMMLQQTQVVRVRPKYREFIKKFPNFHALARAPLGDILRAWQGLGYNRRALYLKRIAQEVVFSHNGNLPNDEALLRRFPGVGQSTAGAIRVFAFNLPAVFIETNICTAFIHHFFPHAKKVSEEKIRRLVETTAPWRAIASSLALRHPYKLENVRMYGKAAGASASPCACPQKCSCIREWYWALMDYGTWLKENRVRYNSRIIGYRPQSRFRGSPREIRGKVLKLLSRRTFVGEKTLRGEVLAPKSFLERAIAGLAKDGLIENRGVKYTLSK